MGRDLETHGEHRESKVVSEVSAMLREEDKPVDQHQSHEVDQPQEVRPDVYRLIGPDECTRWCCVCGVVECGIVWIGVVR